MGAPLLRRQYLDGNQVAHPARRNGYFCFLLLHAAQIGLAAAGRRALHGNLRWGLILVLSGCGKMPNWNEVPEENPSGAEAPSLLLRRLRHD